ncbi:MobA/MobL family protein [Tepidicaulis sp. LMO-SS28]|uniref:MobA/MobL family protein n=1 Tax=Tepidicaulis sp. LMO-SS28 TaxID=3447455 RepID=UPI003EDF3B95
MAIYHFSVSTISRAKGRSATAAAAYRSGEALCDDRLRRTFDYRKKRGVIWTGLVDGNKTEDPSARERLWNLAEAAEKRKDAKVAREIVLALPDEIPFKENVKLARGMALWLRERHGVAVDVAVHAPDPGGDGRNIHAHLLLSTRVYDGEKFGGKTKELDRKPESRDHICAWRKEWEKRANRALEKAGRSEWVSCMSLKEAHELNDLPPVEPCEHLGPARTQAERRGERTRAGDRNRARISERRERGGLIRERMALDCKISAEEREYYRSVVRPEQKAEEDETAKQAPPQSVPDDEPSRFPMVEDEDDEREETERDKRKRKRKRAEGHQKPLDKELSDTMTAIWERGGFTRQAGRAVALVERAKEEKGKGWQKYLRDSLTRRDRAGLAATLRSARRKKLIPQRIAKDVGRFMDFLDDLSEPKRQRSEVDRIL